MLKQLVRSYSDLISLLQIHELRNKQNNPQPMSHHAIVYGEVNNKRNQNKNFSSRGKGFTLTSSCGGQNTKPDDKEHEKTKGVPSQNKNGLNSVISCQICGKKGHGALKC
ncbi:hypothetical protein CFOL_v3_16487 [Cephalotus follicularis]|uniref:Uncharacterized protein n=1 Tax=Cephalotus follicularis TaxID=3775 RepID=A0A1Q3BYB5_CEPFO|nr:hypothetical protein CFOL_v3_16487 [Cephalotus follicularis]